MVLKEKGPPNLAERLLDLQSLALPGASYAFKGGRELIFRADLSPTAASRVYTCELHVPPGKGFPHMIVVSPNLKVLAEGRKIPHTYPYEGRGVCLCLWMPKLKEWNWHMKLTETYIPWALRWLYYFEDWLYSGDWAGGGAHPESARRRYGAQSMRNSSNAADTQN
jgi:hypothetical protein